jgi:hypothetical protein
MSSRRSVGAALSAWALSVTAAAGALLALGAGHAQAATPIPAHVFAPYFEAYSNDSPAQWSAQSGAKYLTMAFLQTPSKGSCTPTWNGSTSTPVDSSVYGSDIATIRSRGGDVIPSFGGYSADHGGTDIADSCTSVASIAAAYEKVVTTYDVTRIDLDIEDKSLTNSAGITRRNQAVAQVEAWAAANGRTVQLSYTLPSTTSGLDSGGTKVLNDAVANGARADVANIMTFDYYDGASHEMATDTETAATGLYGLLARIYPSKSSAQLWGMIGITEMIGIDDYGAAETFTTADAATVLKWTQSKGISTLSYWALERDNGGCVGTKGSDTCSGVAQSTWFFSNAFEPFTSGSQAGDDFSVSVTPAADSANPGGSLSATVATAVASGSAESVTLSASGAPAGVTVGLSPKSVTSGASSTLSVAVAADATPGAYPITITGTASSGSHSAVYTLTVNSGTGPGGRSYEAEAATLGGSARVASCPSCSGGQDVSSVGGSGHGTVTFAGVTEPSAGSYTLTVHYLSANKARTATVTVNGTARTVGFPATSGSTVGTATVTVQLRAGANTVAFSGASGSSAQAPGLDRIDV